MSLPNHIKWKGRGLKCKVCGVVKTDDTKGWTQEFQHAFLKDHERCGPLMVPKDMMKRRWAVKRALTKEGMNDLYGDTW